MAHSWASMQRIGLKFRPFQLQCKTRKYETQSYRTSAAGCAQARPTKQLDNPTSIRQPAQQTKGRTTLTPLSTSTSTKSLAPQLAPDLLPVRNCDEERTCSTKPHFNTSRQSEKQTDKQKLASSNPSGHMSSKL